MVQERQVVISGWGLCYYEGNCWHYGRTSGQIFIHWALWRQNETVKFMNFLYNGHFKFKNLLNNEIQCIIPIEFGCAN